MSGPDFSSRRNKLIRSLKPLGISTLLVSGESNVRYLTGFSGDSSWLCLSRNATVLVSDSRYSTQIYDECPDLDTEIRAVGKSMSEATARVVKATGTTQLGVEAQHLTVAQHASLAQKIDSANLVITDGLTERLRAIKDRWEITQIRQAIYQAERGITVSRARLRPAPHSSRLWESARRRHYLMPTRVTGGLENPRCC